MRTSLVKSNPRPKPFIKDSKLEIAARYNTEQGMREFTATYKGKSKTFKINKDYNIIKAWKEMETWLDKMN